MWIFQQVYELIEIMWNIFLIQIIIPVIIIIGALLYIFNRKDKKKARRIAREMLDQGDIDDLARFNMVCDYLAKDRYNRESAELLKQLEQLEAKQ